MCTLFLVPRLTVVECPSSLLWRADLLSVVSCHYPCVVTSLCDAPDDCAHSALGSRLTKTLPEEEDEEEEEEILPSGLTYRHFFLFSRLIAG